MPQYEKKIFFDQGALRNTGNPLNVAIDGDGFFQVQTKSGDVFLTRSGDFRLNTNRELVDAAGNRVLSDGGSLTLSSGQGDVFIDDQGQVFQGSTVVGKISVVDVPDKSVLMDVGGAFMIDPSKTVQTQTPKSYHVLQGALEQSNHSVVEGMVNLMDLGRSHESAHTLIRSLEDQSDRMMKVLGNRTA
ncbi:MAG: hypothetical protein B7X06_03950 [Verrucomicrobia bacterium 21-51-4]|nr:MAG: hypothetical protein B7X06_03950 [Verrucomicrobia bacterium 21-51-4]